MQKTNKKIGCDLMNEEIEKIFNEYKTINRTKIEGNNFLKVESYLCELNNGKKIKREKILKAGKDGNAVVIFPITKEKKSNTCY